MAMARDCSGTSFAIFVIVATVCVRSMFAEDSIWRTRSVGEGGNAQGRCPECGLGVGEATIGV